MDLTCFVYGLRAVDADTYFYIGSTKYEPAQRLADHLYSVKCGTHLNRHFCNKVRKIGFDNVAVDVLEVVNPLNRWEREKAWITELLAGGTKLVNRIHNDRPMPITGRTMAELYAKLKAVAEMPRLTTWLPNFELDMEELHKTIKGFVKTLEQNDWQNSDYDGT